MCLHGFTVFLLSPFGALDIGRHHVERIRNFFAFEFCFRPAIRLILSTTKRERDGSSLRLRLLHMGIGVLHGNYVVVIDFLGVLHFSGVLSTIFLLCAIRSYGAGMRSLVSSVSFFLFPRLHQAEALRRDASISSSLRYRGSLLCLYERNHTIFQYELTI